MSENYLMTSREILSDTGKPIQDRMPVILDPEQSGTWLSPQEHQADKLLPRIRPDDSCSMQAWPVTRELNGVGLRDDSGLYSP